MHIKFPFDLTQTQKIIIFISLIFILGSAYLFSVDSRYNDPYYNSDWFSIGFSNPQSENFDFVLENFSKNSDFQWELIQVESGEKILAGSVQVPPQEKKEILVDPGSQKSGRLLIKVSSENETREIYRNISL